MHRMTNRAMAVAAGVLLVLVPTLFSVFPEWTRWSVGVRVAVLAAWGAVAAVVVAAGAAQSERIDDLVGKPLRRRERARRAAAQRLIHALLSPSALPVRGSYEFTLYRPSPDGTKLVPEHRSSGASGKEWEIREDAVHGVTGAAWTSRGYTAEKGGRVSDATYGLSPDEQARYAHLTGVAACPVPNARGEPVGVLTAATTEPDPPVHEKEFVEAMLGLSQVVSRILIDIARVARD